MTREVPPVEHSRLAALDRCGLFHEAHDDTHVLVEGAFVLNLRTSARRAVPGAAAGLLVLGLHQHIQGLRPKTRVG